MKTKKQIIKLLENDLVNLFDRMVQERDRQIAAAHKKSQKLIKKTRKV